ncbi:MAG: hypothetical protein WCO84_00960 [bacterium]
MRKLTTTEKAIVKDYYKAYCNNFVKAEIMHCTSTKLYCVVENDRVVIELSNIYEINGWLFGAIQAVHNRITRKL